MAERAASERRMTLGAFVQDACHDYHRRLLAPGPSLEAPRFRVGGAEERQLTLTAPETLWDDLRLEAGRQGIDLARLVEHAVMLRTALGDEA